MSLVLDIEHLLGVAFAATGPESAAPDWPPQPDRIFSALVASWAARGEAEDEADALHWLEALEPPRILAAGAEPRTAALRYVPPNDTLPYEALTNPKKEKKIREWGVFRSRQERNFPAARIKSVPPGNPTVRLIWEGATPSLNIIIALNNLAKNTSYIGHSASLTRCLFHENIELIKDYSFHTAKRRIYPGRFAELRRVYAQNRRPNPGAPILDAAAPAAATAAKSPFASENWLVLKHVGGPMPDLRAAPLVAKTIRDTILAGYGATGVAIPEWVSGHQPDGSPSNKTHLAIIPLPYVGFDYGDGHVMGYALVPPREIDPLKDPAFKAALRHKLVLGEDAERVLEICPRRGTGTLDGFSPLRLALTQEVPAASLDPEIYTKPAKRFATVTPIILDKHLKTPPSKDRIGNEGREAEIIALLMQACRNLRLPEPLRIVPGKHSAFRGAPSAWRVGSAPSWTGWRLPTSLGCRKPVHAVIEFAEQVEGPVILGAGRYVGLGLCRPLPDAEGVSCPQD